MILIKHLLLLLSNSEEITVEKPPSIVPEKSTNISFNDNDNVLDMGTNKRICY